MDKAPMHTPGPWSIRKNFNGRGALDLFGEGGQMIIGNALIINQEADARLIAAAPELLEAAQDAVEGFKTLRIGLRDNKAAIECIDAHIDELNYAIAGATGIPT